jgi:O-antigen ligase
MRRYWLSRRVWVPIAVVAGFFGAVTLVQPGYISGIVEARLSTDSQGSRIHRQLYELAPTLVEQHPTLGLGVNTFSVWYAFYSGGLYEEFGPHSWYLQILVETGVVGALWALCVLAWILSRVRLLLLAGRARSQLPDDDGLRRSLAWGLAAAFAATLAGNVFYLTMIYPSYYLLILLAVCGVPVLYPERRRALARRRAPVPGLAPAGAPAR